MRSLDKDAERLAREGRARHFAMPDAWHHHVMRFDGHAVWDEFHGRRIFVSLARDARDAKRAWADYRRGKGGR